MKTHYLISPFAPPPRSIFVSAIIGVRSEKKVRNRAKPITTMGSRERKSSIVVMEGRSQPGQRRRAPNSPALSSTCHRIVGAVSLPPIVPMGSIVLIINLPFRETNGTAASELREKRSSARTAYCHGRGGAKLLYQISPFQLWLMEDQIDGR